MKANNYYIDIATHSLNKYKEELCGDKVEIFKTSDRTIIVLADGLGSGIKANILATLTTKIAGTMLKKGESIKETIDTIMKTLPVCKIRKIAYSTFGIIEIDKYNNCTIIEYDNPPIFYIRNGKIINLNKNVVMYDNKKVKFSKTVLLESDALILVSDGVIHAGVGHVLNYGWEWEHVAEYLEKQHVKTAEELNRRLIETCNTLYEGSPGDDTTSVTIKVRTPEIIEVFTGPPENPKDDEYLVRKLMEGKGKKIVCGGTAAKIVARELDKEVKTSFDYIDLDVPPIATIDGIDLVTEGVLTLKKTIDKLEEYKVYKIKEKEISAKKDGASLLANMFLNECTHVNFLVGKAINPAHQNPDFPIEMSIKLNIVDQLISVLESIGKIVTINYI